MTSAEDIVRSTTQAIAGTVSDVPPLRLPHDQDELAPAAPAFPEPAAGAPRAPRAHRAHRSRAWVAPIAAAAAVIALAVSLVIVRDAPNGRGVSPSAGASVSRVPPHYVALIRPGKSPAQASLAIGDTISGARLATIAPPRGSSFIGVTGAADDRTFVVSTMRMARNGVPSFAVTWYLLRIASAHAGYTLTKLAIPDMRSWGVQAIALSGSGRELAMTLYPANSRTSSFWELRIYSVATGKLLRSWSSRGSTVLLGFAVTLPGLQDQPLSWADGDRGVVFPTFVVAGNGLRESKRLIDVTSRSGKLIANSRVIWSAPAKPGAPRCIQESPQVTADGKTVLCVSESVSGGNQGSGRVTLEWLAYSVSAPAAQPRVLYRVTVRAPRSDARLIRLLWSDASGSTLIIEWSVARSTTASTVHTGIISHGRFRPIPAIPGPPDFPTVTW